MTILNRKKIISILLFKNRHFFGDWFKSSKMVIINIDLRLKPSLYLHIGMHVPAAEAWLRSGDSGLWSLLWTLLRANLFEC
jgi:hypothetical protein